MVGTTNMTKEIIGGSGYQLFWESCKSDELEDLENFLSVWLEYNHIKGADDDAEFNFDGLTDLDDDYAVPAGTKPW